MKEKVTQLDELADLEELQDDSDLDVEDDSAKVKPAKTEMCKKLLQTGKCNQIKDKTCKFAHNAIELNLIPVSAKIKNLNTVIQA